MVMQLYNILLFLVDLRKISKCPAFKQTHRKTKPVSLPLTQSKKSSLFLLFPLKQYSPIPNRQTH